MVDDSYLRCWMSNTETTLKDIKEQSSPEYILHQCIDALHKCKIQERVLKEQSMLINAFMSCFISGTTIAENKMRKLYEVRPDYTRIGEAVVAMLRFGIHTSEYAFDEFVEYSDPETYEYIIRDRNHKLFNYLKER